MDRKFIVGMAKDWALALVIVFAVLLAWRWFEPGPPSSGSAPDFALTDLDGANVHLGDLQGVAVVNFWATWCGPCRGEIPELSAFHAAHPDVTMVGVSIDDSIPTSHLAIAAQRLGITYRVLHDADGRAAAAYGVDSIPVTFILNKDHQIVDVIQGGTTAEELAAAVAEAG